MTLKKQKPNIEELNHHLPIGVDEARKQIDAHIGRLTRKNTARI